MTSDYPLFRIRSQSLGITNISQNAIEEKMSVLTSLLESGYSVEIDIDGTNYNVALVEKKDSENESIKKISSSYSNPVSIGTEFEYNDETWLVFSQYFDVVDAFFTGEAIRCNETITFKNNYGIVESLNVYLKGSMKGFQNETFGGSPLTEQDNAKLLLICSADTTIGLKDRFFVKDKVWEVINIDPDSVNGILYLSCEENEKYNIDNDIAESIVDNWEILQQDIYIVVDEIEELNPTILKNDVIKQEDFVLIADDSEITVENNTIKTLGVGTFNLMIKIKNTNITKNIEVHSILSSSEYIQSRILPDRTKVLTGMKYVFYGENIHNGVVSENIGSISIIEGENFLESYEIEGNSISFIVDREGPLAGDLIILNYEEDGETATKELMIKRLL